ncbi:helix-turn-helix protein [Tahibacter aquaticus]|uniref:Helix-turn-helix protein n=1 Tax=Tahibacter aquaticus TaxID=520092 RepID=A0A4R6YPM1_9GAMM|nr:helix-turn-helix transcriptional regulator [Tahibacter aquaticus]TDR39675.1 helix-turn-helix protein [Tahibacter aquaticus]
MPNIASALKGEITRVARKAVKAELDALRNASAGYRKEIAALKRTVASLQRNQASVEKKNKAKVSETEDAADAEAAGGRIRFSAKGLKTLRAKLGLSAQEFGRLAGASGQSIYNWEQEKNTPRQEQIQRIAALRGMGKKEAKARLETLAQSN